MGHSDLRVFSDQNLGQNCDNFEKKSPFIKFIEIKFKFTKPWKIGHTIEVLCN